MSDGPNELELGTSERQWQGTVMGYLRFYGWLPYHAPDNKPTTTKGGRQRRQRVTPGFPDVVAVRRLPGLGPELLIAELKAERGRLGPGQAEWLDAFKALEAGLLDLVGRAGVDARTPRVTVGVWKPSQARELEALIAGPAGVGVMVAGGGLEL